MNSGWFDKADLFVALEKYIFLHYEIFGNATPMPTNPPQKFLDEHASKTFLEFLKYHNLEVIIGVLQYAYEVQGYGTLSTIRAFYGLIMDTTFNNRNYAKRFFGMENTPCNCLVQGVGRFVDSNGEKRKSEHYIQCKKSTQLLERVNKRNKPTIEQTALPIIEQSEQLNTTETFGFAQDKLIGSRIRWFVFHFCVALYTSTTTILHSIEATLNAILSFQKE